MIKKIISLFPIGLIKFLLSLKYRRFPEIHAIELTNRCPFKCIMCPRTFKMTRTKGNMEFAVFRSIIDQIAERRVQMYPIWLHQMGESVLHPDLIEFINYASGKSVTTALSLSPFVLKKEKAEKLAQSGIKKLLFSIDGVDNKSFEHFRGIPNAFQKTIENLEYILDYIQKRRIHIEIIISMIGFAENKKLIDQYKKKFSRYRAKIIVKHFVNWGGGIEEINELENLQSRKRSENITCFKPWYSVVINWEGHVLPCCLDYNAICKLGDVHHEKLSTIWTHSKNLKEIKKAFTQNNASIIPLCAQCSELHTRHSDEAG